MYSREVVVQHELGIHARPASKFIQKANEYKSTVWIIKEDRKMNAKSLLGVLSLGVARGTNITIIAEGSDEELAVNALVELVNSNFPEGE